MREKHLKTPLLKVFDITFFSIVSLQLRKGVVAISKSTYW